MSPDEDVEQEYTVLKKLFPLLDELPTVDDYSATLSKYEAITEENKTTVGCESNKFVLYEIVDEQIDILQRPYDDVKKILQDGERTMFELVNLDTNEDPDVYTLCVTLPKDRTPPETGLEKELPQMTVFYKAKPIDMFHIFSNLLENNAWTVFYFDETLYPERVTGVFNKFSQFNDDGTFNINSINKLQETLSKSRNS